MASMKSQVHRNKASRKQLARKAAWKFTLATDGLKKPHRFYLRMLALREIRSIKRTLSFSYENFCFKDSWEKLCRLIWDLKVVLSWSMVSKNYF